MTEYEYGVQNFHRDEGTVELPDDAVGITVDTFGEHAWIRYLVPVGSG